MASSMKRILIGEPISSQPPFPKITSLPLETILEQDFVIRYALPLDSHGGPAFFDTAQTKKGSSSFPEVYQKPGLRWGAERYTSATKAR